mmetsp:Transcript_57390/g.157594  ORF Transcript_57390/g.157594 Transcript_57390/m.157594 type:complete len:214 (-) Transcript_57390:828-1469(-)
MHVHPFPIIYSRRTTQKTEQTQPHQTTVPAFVEGWLIGTPRFCVHLEFARPVRQTFHPMKARRHNQLHPPLQTDAPCDAPARPRAHRMMHVSSSAPCPLASRVSACASTHGRLHFRKGSYTAATSDSASASLSANASGSICGSGSSRPRSSSQKARACEGASVCSSSRSKSLCESPNVRTMCSGGPYESHRFLPVTSAASPASSSRTSRPASS